MNGRTRILGVAFACACFVLVTGFGFEYKAYKGKQPLGETALLYSVDDQNLEFQSSNILRVDGKFVGIMGPARFSARVLAGTHAFQIRAIWDNNTHIVASGGGVGSAGSYMYKDFELEVKDMQPLHVYVVRYSSDADGVHLRVEDLGERVPYHAGLSATAKF